MRSKRTVVLAVLVLLAGCTGLGNSAGAGGQQSAESADVAGRQPAAADASADGDAIDQLDAAGQQRAIVRSGRMVVEVSNFSQSREAIASRLRARGGYVNSTTRQRHTSGDRVWVTGTVVLRIPSGNYSAMQDVVAAQGTVLSERTGTRDVTDRLVDIEARLENLRDRRDRLRTLYERANDTEAVLSVGAELSEVQGEIERLEARQRALENRVAYSTLRVDLREDAPGRTDATAFHERPLLSVLADSVGAMVVAGRTLLVLAVAALPWVAVLSVPVVGAVLLVRRRGLPLRGGSDDGE